MFDVPLELWYTSWLMLCTALSGRTGYSIVAQLCRLVEDIIGQLEMLMLRGLSLPFIPDTLTVRSCISK